VNGEQAPGFGALSTAFGVQGIPHAVVIDPQGNVAGRGTLSSVLEKADELADDLAAEQSRKKSGQAD
jgi:hypothetical protein